MPDPVDGSTPARGRAGFGRRARTFLAREALPAGAIVLAAASMALVPPDAAYLSYFDFRVLALLFCLMAVVAGSARAGLFDALSAALLDRSASRRRVEALLVGACYLASMLVTNDVALLAFVPLTLGVLQFASPARLAFVVSLEAVAANLGSMLTPVGNPQNLYLYTYYGMDLGPFLAALAPYSALALGLLGLAVLAGRDAFLEVDARPRPALAHRGRLLLHAVLFAVCLLAVLRLVPVRACFAAVLAGLLAFDRRALLGVDYGLLATFAAFFVFVGNLARVPAVEAAARSLVQGRELLAGAAASQLISNVPAAILLSGFTRNARGLLLGVDLGGLGTLVASLASLIAFRLYARRPGARPLLFLGIFTAVNLAFLGALLGLAALLGDLVL